MKFTRIYKISFLITVIALVSFIPVNKKRIAAKKSATTRNAETVNKNNKVNPYYIIVDKSDYELYVYDDEGWYATYPIVFGSKDLSDKMREGDKKTPDGNFKVIIKKYHPQMGARIVT